MTFTVTRQMKVEIKVKNQNRNLLKEKKYTGCPAKSIFNNFEGQHPTFSFKKNHHQICTNITTYNNFLQDTLYIV